MFKRVVPAKLRICSFCAHTALGRVDIAGNRERSGVWSARGADELREIAREDKRCLMALRGFREMPWSRGSRVTRMTTRKERR
jgi:hypothetical protein